MQTKKQVLGDKGEKLVSKYCTCPKCKREGTLKQLRQNFICADLICDFCGYLAQVKSKSSNNINILPKSIPGAAWEVQKERLDSGIYMPLFIVLYASDNEFSVYYLPVDFQSPELFIPRKPLSENAKRSGWQGFYYDFTKLQDGSIVRLK